MAASKLNLKIEQGATFRHRLVWSNASGVGIDLTGYTARMHVRKNLEDAAVLIELTTENSKITLDNLGAINLLIEADETAAITWTSAIYDLELVNGTEVTRLLQGSISVSREVTRNV